MIRKRVVNLLNGRAGYIVRRMISSPDQHWSGHELAKELCMSPAWVNRVLDNLVAFGVVKRTQRGVLSFTEVVSNNIIIEKWVSHYDFNMNPTRFYLLQKKNPVKLIDALAEKEGFSYALTGYAAANLVEKTTYNGVPSVYLVPKSGFNSDEFNNILGRLENVYNFIPVNKQANVIVMQPLQREAVLFDVKKIRGINCVSPLQLYLDLYGLDRGKFVIEALNDYFQKHKLFYES